ncbi:cytochrome-c oxidase, cbb3-type subunit III [Pseudaminobacter soli (ex Li et al. 2025)]|uniref:Cbb3-type cytochrome c oxidase subunit n=1 Tax=Pseudaminobacter soli (ex Li et al. 2025) TaxID=1295366 RepID=A0A2P7RXX8_9HYPH|nr:cytochrome-c oxidase, cbb3-type subunit III [Mesorhizobium soli]PSJ55049.1 cytochrome-c oxidase, cbb3-type subunit III [Mesorhizobium soli]
MTKREIDQISGVETTGHEWDGIKELNNPMPRWWVLCFYVTIVWALGYTIAYPAWPMISSATTGLLGFSSRGELKNAMAEADAAKQGFADAIAAKSVTEIIADDKLREFATAAGAAAFKVNCIQCHGSGAEGSPGFPNLNDDDWLWGGSADAIHQTIAHGIRYAGDADTRVSEMPAFGEILEKEQIRDVAAYVHSLTGTPSDAAAATAGKQVFADNCAVCHGDDAKGNREVGAPNLADAIWLYGSSEADIARQVRTPRHGVMPAWSARLGETTVKELAVYVHSLGGGE